MSTTNQQAEESEGKATRRPNWLSGAAVIALLLVAAACGGGGKKDPTPTPEPPTPAVSPTPADLTPAQILEQNKASVVNIDTVDPYGRGGGSGVIWEDGSHVLTNAHVVLGASTIKVTDPADGSRSFPAKVVALSPCDDVALLSVDRASGLKPAKIGNSDNVKPGDSVVALGFPDTLSSRPLQPYPDAGQRESHARNLHLQRPA
jgi:putative serine protease PepD